MATWAIGNLLDGLGVEGGEQVLVAEGFWERAPQQITLTRESTLVQVTPSINDIWVKCQ